MNPKQVIIHQLKLMKNLAGVVASMDRHYNDYPVLNDVQPKNTGNWLPMSMDEWLSEIYGAIEDWGNILANTYPAPEYPDQTHAAIKKTHASELSREDMARLVNWSNVQGGSMIEDLCLQELLNVYRMSAEYDLLSDWIAEKGNVAIRAWNHVTDPKNHLQLFGNRWENEFPDYPKADMPLVPENWIDTSWHNDAAPSFEPMPDVRLFIDYADPAVRDVSEGKRFVLAKDESGGRKIVTVLETDSWTEVQLKIEELKNATTN